RRCGRRSAGQRRTRRRAIRRTAGTSASHVQDGIRVSGVLPQGLDGLGRREDEQLDVAGGGFEVHIINHGQGRGTGPDDKATALPGKSSPPSRAAWPNWSRNFLDGFFFLFRISPRSITTS